MCGGHLLHMLIPVMAASAGQTTGGPEAKVAAANIPCPRCGAAITPEFSWCPKCGAALRPHPCSYCRQTISPGDKTCSFCGAPPG